MLFIKSKRGKGYCVRCVIMYTPYTLVRELMHGVTQYWRGQKISSSRSLSPTVWDTLFFIYLASSYKSWRNYRFSALRPGLTESYSCKPHFNGTSYRRKCSFEADEELAFSNNLMQIMIDYNQGWLVEFGSGFDLLRSFIVLI